MNACQIHVQFKFRILHANFTYTLSHLEKDHVVLGMRQSIDVVFSSFRMEAVHALVMWWKLLVSKYMLFHYCTQLKSIQMYKDVWCFQDFQTIRCILTCCCRKRRKQIDGVRNTTAGVISKIRCYLYSPRGMILSNQNYSYKDSCSRC